MSKYQGVRNSKTSSDETMFGFEVGDEKGLMECMDIFAHQFIQPLLTTQSIQDHIATLDHEHLSDIHSQPRTQYYALKMLITHSHPYSKFFTGNSQSLNHTNLQHSLTHFFNRYYSSNIMKLIIITSLSPNFLFH